MHLPAAFIINFFIRIKLDMGGIDCLHMREKLSVAQKICYQLTIMITLVSYSPGSLKNLSNQTN